MNPVFRDLPVTVFETMSRLAGEHGAVNLGQGFPDDPGPADVREAAARAVVDGPNQYPPMMGLPALREAVAAHYARHQGLKLDPANVMITSGATEALAGALLALLEPGDEVVVFQPAYDAYLPLIRRAGGVPRFVTLRPPEWRLSEEALSAAFSTRTRVVLVNDPLNPTGTRLSAEERALIARFCVRHDAIALCDEVWEHVVFGEPHRSLLAEPGMGTRTVKIGSAGKIFSLTGWKVGFVCAAPALLKGLAKAHQFLTFTTPPNLQVAVAHGLAKEETYFTGMRAEFRRSRDRLSAGLEGLGFAVLPCEGTYFLNVDLERSDPALAGETPDDEAFCRRLVTEGGVAAIPVSAFYDAGGGEAVRTAVRFCFAKRDATLDEALNRLERLRAARAA